MPTAVGLLRAEEIVCRAWDEAMNTQPDTFTWNLMGMLNNCHYRVKVLTCPARQLKTPQGL
jgi:nitrate reductase (NAD(P)H)